MAKTKKRVKKVARKVSKRSLLTKDVDNKLSLVIMALALIVFTLAALAMNK